MRPSTGTSNTIGKSLCVIEVMLRSLAFVLRSAEVRTGHEDSEQANLNHRKTGQSATARRSPAVGRNQKKRTERLMTEKWSHATSRFASSSIFLSSIFLSIKSKSLSAK